MLLPGEVVVVVMFCWEQEVHPWMKLAKKNCNGSSLSKSNLGSVKMTTVECYRLLIVLNGNTLLYELYLCRMS